MKFAPLTHSKCFLHNYRMVTERMDRLLNIYEEHKNTLSTAEQEGEGEGVYCYLK